MSSQYEKDAALSYVGNASVYLESLYSQYQNDPKSVSSDWQQYFSELQGQVHEMSPKEQRELAMSLVKERRRSENQAPQVQHLGQGRVEHMIDMFRFFGHLYSNTNPLKKAPHLPDFLQLKGFHITHNFEKLVFSPDNFTLGEEKTAAAIHEKMCQAYCGSITLEAMHLSHHNEWRWVMDYYEQSVLEKTFSETEKLHLYEKLMAAEMLEHFLDRRYKGQKRFSLEGGDALIPLLDVFVQKAAKCNKSEMVFGMAHRGRLNVLTNTLGKPTQNLFDEFEGRADFGNTTGDVKYHMGYSNDIEINDGKDTLHLSLSYNPSHLEFICPVVLGSVRGREDRWEVSRRGDAVVPILIHGDAAFIGQGIMLETLNLSQTRAYHTGGTIHIIVNNQIGYTTSFVKDQRSSRYSSDVAKVIEAPIIHVNADDVEAVARAADVAFAYREKFRKDVVIDLVCYRRYGHQEVDNPEPTQPQLYSYLKTHKTSAILYHEHLSTMYPAMLSQMEAFQKSYLSKLDAGDAVFKAAEHGLRHQNLAHWEKYYEQDWDQQVHTGLDLKHLLEIGQELMQRPDGFHCHPHLLKMQKQHEAMLLGEKSVDWGFAEALAFASLLDQNYSIRFTGQDVRRGTFYHRHAFIFDVETGAEYSALAEIAKRCQQRFEMYDSTLSEQAVVGFEYGYSQADPESLTLWEAQFGDFVNGAQVMIDQFISSGWQKWRRLSGLVMLLPHGLEGMGPEHSSARLERFLQLCAQQNMQVIVPSTPAQYFHALRRQMLRNFRRPLIIMSPKSLLRHRQAVSTLSELSRGSFLDIIPEQELENKKKWKRIIFCSGKVYYDLIAKRKELELDTAAIVRIEQLYPFPYEELKVLLETMPHLSDVIWCQEEAKNQGAWFRVQPAIKDCLLEGQKLRYVGRPSFAAPACGYAQLHKQQQAKLVSEALESIND